MRQASLLIVTSQWYETFGRVAIEAFAQGTPVLASNIGAIGEVVTPGITGLHFEPGNTADLARNIQWAVDHPDHIREMGVAARQEYETTYTPRRNYDLLMDIYRRVLHEPQALQDDAPEHSFINEPSEVLIR
jgi:glycosyltransferase involved in cell wall biosynthesis